MATKSYFIKFGPGDPRANTGLFPTFIIFSLNGSTTVTAPSITESPQGSGLYKFQYGATSSVTFLIDGQGSLSSLDRYVSGVLDPVQAVDQQLGFITDLFGSTLVDPGSMWGFFKRFIDLFEGDQVYKKSTGEWFSFNRGASTLLRVKHMTNDNTSSKRSGT